MDNETTYDVVVIGGGAAGLSGALVLGRARRTVLVVDAGTPRNAPAAHLHNYLGREGASPHDLLAIGREEVARYGVQVVDGEARSATRRPDGSFVVQLADRSVTARRLLLASGIVDVLPDVPGLAEGWGRTVLHCPYCHGWEVRDHALGILATGDHAVHQALAFRQLSSDIVLFQHTAPPFGEEELEKLAARGVQVVEGEVAAWGPDGVRLVDGTVVERQELVVAAVVRARLELLGDLGLELTDYEMDGQVVATYVAADPMGLTAVPGVWVAGNLADPRAQVINAAAGGLVAGAGINADLGGEDIQIAVEQHRGARAAAAR